ncbi:hypothetical protein [Lapidilactobacillus luobeiensis]|uniref:hypothetical protein n=1 Tax=Lapidilactobacillus luobeiensis TaxID=2950371 RepID=UPI0021C405D1|nr:hypothetical protein [Lapidilactobacillus luobeiensis]
MTEKIYRRLLLKTLPALILLGLFTHLRQTSGIDWRPQWFDLYLVLSYCGGLPWLKLTGQRWWQKRHQQDDPSQVAQTQAAPDSATTAASVPPLRTTWLDHLFIFCGELALNSLWLLLSGPFAVAYWSWRLLKMGFSARN